MKTKEQEERKKEIMHDINTPKHSLMDYLHELERLGYTSLANQLGKIIGRLEEFQHK